MSAANDKSIHRQHAQLTVRLKKLTNFNENFDEL